MDAAKRETLEEAGVKINLTGILSVQCRPKRDYMRMRVIFLAEPLDEEDCEPKTIPDYESVGAIWALPEDIGRISLRGAEPLHWSKYLAEGGQVYPLSILGPEA